MFNRNDLPGMFCEEKSRSPCSILVDPHVAGQMMLNQTGRRKRNPGSAVIERACPRTQTAVPQGEKTEQIHSIKRLRRLSSEFLSFSSVLSESTYKLYARSHLWRICPISKCPLQPLLWQAVYARARRINASEMAMTSDSPVLWRPLFHCGKNAPQAPAPAQREATCRFQRSLPRRHERPRHR